MKENYSYPLDLSWTTEEMTTVLNFLNQVENYYESKVDCEHFKATYAEFKKVVPSKMQEKQIGRQFEEASGYSLYRAVKGVEVSSGKFTSDKKA